MVLNALGQPVGEVVPGWSGSRRPDGSTLQGRYCRVERLSAQAHAQGLHLADQHDEDGASWTYLPYGPFPDLASYRRWVLDVAVREDPLFYAVVDVEAGAATGRPVGVLSLMRTQPEAGSIEVGHVHLSPLVQRRRGATEAQYLLMRHVFEDLRYRRYEWKCDALNAPSRSAAERLGFTYEGTFRQASVVRGRNRDTAWYSILDSEWARVGDRLRRWLAPGNFDGDGRQRTSLRSEPEHARGGRGV